MQVIRFMEVIVSLGTFLHPCVGFKQTLTVTVDCLIKSVRRRPDSDLLKSGRLISCREAKHLNLTS